MGRRGELVAILPLGTDQIDAFVCVAGASVRGMASTSVGVVIKARDLSDWRRRE
jgi:hypothetical protein